MIDKHMDSMKGYTVAIYNIAAVALSHATAIAWLQVISLLIGITVGLLTIWEKVRRNRMKLVILGAVLALPGCTTPKVSRHAVAGVRQVQTATLYVEKAKAAGTRAKESVATAKEAVAGLERTATPVQRPYIAKLNASLIRMEQENEVIRVSLNEAEPKLAGANASIELLGLKLMKAEENARDYRRLKLWMALVGAIVMGYCVFELIPPIGPIRYYGVGATAIGAAILIYTLL